MRRRGATWTTFQDKAEGSDVDLFILAVVMVATIAVIVYVERAYRKIPVHYAKARGGTADVQRPEHRTCP